MLLTLVMIWLLALCWKDWRERRLPNWLTLGGAAVALVWRLGYGGGGLFLDGFATACLAGFFLFIPFLLHGAGGGDVKMMFAAGAVVGWSNLLPLLLFTSFGGVLVILLMLACKKLDTARIRHYARCVFDWRYDRRNGRENLPPADSERVRVPFSLAIAVGTCIPLFPRFTGG
ncbi:MAG: prepilin peptidase [Lentisphaeria bacterium]|nr:prepilin peptidase [Lentisphaeria bacterium]